MGPSESSTVEPTDDVFHAAQKVTEAERSHAELQALVAESERSLLEARKAVAAAARDRGWHQVTPAPSTQEDH